MVSSILLSLSFSLAVALASRQDPGRRPEWDDPAVLHVNTEQPHATMMGYPSADLARRGDRIRSPWFLSLNGSWKFKASRNLASRPVDFFQPGYDVTKWSGIRVPGNI